MGGRVPLRHLGGGGITRGALRRGRVAGGSRVAGRHPRRGGTPSCVCRWDPAFVFLVARRCLSPSSPWAAPAPLPPRPSLCVRAAPLRSRPLPRLGPNGPRCVRVSPPRPPRPVASLGGVLSVPEGGAGRGGCVGGVGSLVQVQESVLAGLTRLLAVGGGHKPLERARGGQGGQLASWVPRDRHCAGSLWR